MTDGSNEKPYVSVIIPTYNRKDSLLRTLESLERQTYAVKQFEVIAVDDGSTDGTSSLLAQKRNLRMRVVRQENQGQVAALNHGARLSRGEMLMFLDDDAVVPSNLISCVTEVHQLHERAIVLPVVQEACADPEDLFAQIVTQSHVPRPRSNLPTLGRFTDLVGCCFTVKKKHFFEIGLMQTLPGKLWPDWNDVDFAYRAEMQGFGFWVCPGTTVLHFESAVSSLAAACARSFNAGRSAIALSERHPGLIRQLSMFNDKGQIAWGTDAPVLIARKLARQIVSSRPVLCGMEKAARVLEAHYPSPTILERLYDWIMSAYIFKGYRQGLQELDARRSGAVPSLCPGLDHLPGTQGVEGEAREPGENATP